MGPINDWTYMLAAMAGLTVITFVCRASFFMLPQSVELPTRVEQALRFAPACALTAIIAPGVFTRDQQIYLSLHNSHMWALLVASIVFAKTRNMLAMMGVGMAVFTVLRLWF